MKRKRWNCHWDFGAYFETELERYCRFQAVALTNWGLRRIVLRHTNMHHEMRALGQRLGGL